MRNIYIVLLLYTLLTAVTLVFSTGTGDGGDSVVHYLFARYAPLHPKLFFDHWAKPVYVLLACPFAQLGFIGIKLFNVILSLLTILVTYKIAVALNFKNSLISAIIIIASPLYYILTFSGLTEPLFALFIATSIYLCVKQKYAMAYVLVSFLPFVRSEGLIIVGVFGIYSLIKKQGKLLPLLLSGHLIYSLAGYFVYYDFLWVFNRIPYAELSSPYGSGKAFHFVEQLLYVVGVPIYILFWIGFIAITVKAIKSKLWEVEQVLILGGFTCFLIAHSLFWYLGIFNSMGLKRVLIGVMPLVALIALQGFNFISSYIPEGKARLKKVVQVLILGYVIIFPFTNNPTAIKWTRDFMLNKGQLEAVKTAAYITTTMAHHRILCADPYMVLTLKIDYFDPDKRINLTRSNMEQMQTGDILIWENWFAKNDANLNKEELDNNPDLIPRYTSEQPINGIVYAVYEKK